MPGNGEILTTSDPEKVLQHAEILVLRQISDGLAQTNRQLGAISDHVTDVRERVIRIEAQEMAKKIDQVERVAEAGRALLHTRTDGACDRIAKLELSMARYQGLFIPLAILGSALLSGAASVMINLVTHR